MPRVVVQQPLFGQHAVELAQGPAQVGRRFERNGVVLCLSGGGFRAAIFHAGALRRLNELGVLAKINSFSCVSGGSIVGGYLASAITNGMRVEGGRYLELDAALDRFLEFTKRDIRTLPVLARLKLWEKSGRAARSLQHYYEQLVGHLKLSDLTSSPRFVFCATDLFFGNSWICEKQRVGDYLAGYVAPPPSDWTLARAIAVSSCFPPVFDPPFVGIPASEFSAPRRTADEGPADALHITESDQLQLELARQKITLTDGGCYDNLGLEPVWKRAATVLVSDGGKPFPFKYVMPGLRLMRYQDVIMNQVVSLRKRWLIDTYQRSQLGTDESTFNGAYWGIMSSTARYPGGAGLGYSKGLAALIANIRTDLNWFSPDEIRVIEKHGYELADIAIRSHTQLAEHPQAAKRGFPDVLLDEGKVKKAIAWSSSRWLSTFTRGQRLLQS